MISALGAVREVADALSGATDGAQVGRIAAARLSELVGVDLVAVYRLSADGSRLELMETSLTELGARFPSQLAVGSGVTGTAAATRQPQVAEDYLETGERCLPEMVVAGVRSMLAVPMVARGRLVGAVTAVSLAPQRFTVEDVELMSTLAAMVGSSLQEADLTAEALRARDRLAWAIQTNSRVQERPMEFAEMADVIIRDVAAMVGADHAGISLLVEDEMELAASTDRKLLGLRQPVGASLVGASLSEGRSLLSNDVLGDARHHPATAARSRTRSMILAPIRHGGSTIGVLSATSNRAGAFDQDDLAAVELLAGVAGWAAVHGRHIEELAEARRWIDSMLSSSRLVIFACDAQGIFTFSEGKGLAALGLNAGELVGQSVQDVYGQIPNVLTSLELALQGVPGQILLEIGDIFMETRYHPVFDSEGRVTGVTGMGIDVTELVNSTRESDAKSKFLANMSHELRTPLNSILGFSQLLLSGEFGHLDERQKRYVGNIHASGGHLLALVNDLLDLAKVAAGKMEMSTRPLPVRERLAPLLDRMRPQAEAKGLTLTLVGGPEVAASADPVRFDQVMLNLLSNAIKFTAEGSVTISVEEAAEGIRVTVADTGCGMTAEELERAFEEFTQMGVSGMSPQGGTGLGLPLARSLAQAMGGSLTGSSTPGVGSSFTVTLPDPSR